MAASSLNLSSPPTLSPSIFTPLSIPRNTTTLSFYSFPLQKIQSLSTSSYNNNILITQTNKNHRRRLSLVVSAVVKKLSESDSVPFEEDGIIFPSDSGVYAIYDATGDLQFIGITRNLAASVSIHKKSVPNLCSSVKVQVVEEPDKTALTEAWKSWMQEHIAATGKVPPGNEPGNTTWVKKAPAKKSDLKLTPGRHVQLTVPLEDLIDRLVKENKVVAFIKGSRHAPLCGFSQRVVGILESQKVDYESVDVLDEEYNNGLRDTLKKYSNWPTFPQVFVNGELVGGCDILSSMNENGELAGLLKQ